MMMVVPVDADDRETQHEDEQVRPATGHVVQSCPARGRRLKAITVMMTAITPLENDSKRPAAMTSWREDFAGGSGVLVTSLVADRFSANTAFRARVTQWPEGERERTYTGRGDYISVGSHTAGLCAVPAVPL